MIKKITELDGRFYYNDTESNNFSRILSGVAWPGVKPGFVVIVAEDRVEDPSLRCRHLRCLAEHEEQDIERLSKVCLDLRERYQIEKLLGDATNESVNELIYFFNKGLPDGVARLTIYDGAFPGDLSYHVQLIKKVTQFVNTTLHLNKCNALHEYLSSFGPEDVRKGKPEDHPAVMALGFILSYLKMHPLQDPQVEKLHRISQEREADYDPLTYGL
jgi:hypothetical protein